MELIPGFRWRLLREFSPAVNFCRFERGDTIYDDPEAYFLPWNEARKKLAISLEVKAPERAKGVAGEEASVFNANWSLPVTVQITDYKTNSTATIECAQGNLYTALWEGDPSCLRSVLPPVPPTSKDLLKWLNDQAKAGSLSFHPLNKLIAGLDCSHVFVVPGDNQSLITRQKVAELEKELSLEFDIKTRQISLPEISDPDFQRYVPTTIISLFGVNTSARCKFLDALKRVLYRPGLTNKGEGARFSLSRHGVVIEKAPLKEKELVCRSFAHGGIFPRLRYNPARCEAASPALITFIRSINDDCPNAQFDLPPRCSELREAFALKGPMNRCQQGELTKLVFECPQAKIIKSWHEHVQKYFLENDPKTLACEIPVWAAPDEDPILKELIPIENTQPFPTLTGHIDLIRFSERLLWIWDYKPNAPAERFASQQVYLYARMLACRTGIPLNSFRCGYFDHGLEATFNPSQSSHRPMPPTNV